MISRKQSRDYLILLSVLLLYAINMYLIISLNSTPPKWDEAVHLRDSIVFYNIISDPFQLNLHVIKDIINKSDLYPLIRPSGYYPPLAPIVTSFLYFIFGLSAKVGIMSNMIFLFILTFSTYQIGRIMFDRSVGLLASVIILLFPIIFQHSTIYYLDLPLTAITSLSVYVILKTENFSNIKFSIAAGLCFGFGMLTKWTFLFFILGPLTYVIVKSYFIFSNNHISKPAFLKRKQLKNIFLFTISAIVTFGLYYFPILAELLKETFKYSKGPLSQGPGSIFSFDSIIFYLTALWKEMITPFGLIIFLVGIVFLSFSKNKYKILLFVWIIIPYFIFTFVIQTKNPRFMMPWLIPISLIISYFIIKISELEILNKKFYLGKYSIVLSLIIFGIFYIQAELKLKSSIVNSSKENWKINEMISVLKRDADNKNDSTEKKPVYLGSIPDHYYINAQTLRYYAALKKLPINFIKLQDYSNTAFEKFVQQFGRYDYILTKNISNIVIPAFQKSIDEMNNYFYSKIDKFECLETFKEPDGSEVSIYKRK